MISSHDIRKKYLEFFAKRGHTIIPSSSLLPANDPTTLFTGSGMQPMITYLLGEKHPSGTRIADSQKCFRAEDIEEVGDNRHLTFFEMLGNWSLGDYFKKEQIPWMFEFLSQELGLDPKRIYVSVFRGNEEFKLSKDTEAVEIWKETFAKVGIEAKDVDFAEKNGMGNGRIFYYPDKKNWWSRAGVPANMPVGEPGGPDSEMFWDFGAHLKIHEQSKWKDEPCHVNCDCGRFMEIGNNVFMMYVKREGGFEELPNKSVDFGGGLERLAAAVNDHPDLFVTDLFASTREILERTANVRYLQYPEQVRPFRFIMDHMRAVPFLIADGGVPSNKDQGYFTRRLIRRSIRFANKLGIRVGFCADIVAAVAREYKNVYPQIFEKVTSIQWEVSQEEEKFQKTLEGGLKQFERSTVALDSRGKLPGKLIFDLYQTYGFPLEVTEELAREKGMSIDKSEYQRLFEEHQELSRKGAEQKFKGGLADHSEQVIRYHTATHLLHASLRKILGDHAVQKGSNITSKRLRFDFAYQSKMTEEQIRHVEALVNQAIQRDYPVSWQEMTVQEAQATGAIGLFGEKYGEKVKVYTIGDPHKLPDANPSSPTFSKEICGGPHVASTGEIGRFKITKEEAVSSGVRRIKAILE